MARNDIWVPIYAKSPKREKRVQKVPPKKKKKRGRMINRALYRGGKTKLTRKKGEGGPNRATGSEGLPQGGGGT